MATQAGIGFSKNLDPSLAAQEAAAQARQRLGQKCIDLAIVFSTVQYAPQEILPVIYESLDKTRVIGCSTAGIILPQGIEPRGIGIVCLRSEFIRFETSHIAHLDLQDRREAGKSFIKNCISDFGQQHRKLLLMFTNGLLPDISALLQGLHEQLAHSIPIVGAGSSDNFAFQKTYQYYQNSYGTNSITGVLLGGRLKFAMSCRHGWKPLGKPRIVDKVEGPVIKSIDGKKAVDIYNEYFPKEHSTLGKGLLNDINFRYPLGTYMPHEKVFLLRNALGVLDDGSILCQDSLTEKSEVHLMIPNKETCIQAAETAAAEVKAQFEGHPPQLILVLESLLRYKLLGRQAFREMEAIQKVFDKTPILGMYSMGEVSSFLGPRNTYNATLQNNGIVVLGLA